MRGMQSIASTVTRAFCSALTSLGFWPGLTKEMSVAPALRRGTSLPMSGERTLMTMSAFHAVRPSTIDAPSAASIASVKLACSPAPFST